MKTGNLLSLLLITTLLAGAIACDVILAAAYRKTDLSDPYKNFERIPVSSFRKLSITGGNGYAIQLEAGAQCSVKLMKSRKSFFTLRQSADSLALQFLVANQTYQEPEDCTVGMIVTAPDMPNLKLSGVNVAITGFDSDSLFIQLDSSAQLRCKKMKVKNLMVEATQGGSVNFQQSNQVNLLSLKLTRHASATLNEIVYNKFQQEINDSASIRFYDNSLGQLLSQITQ